MAMKRILSVVFFVLTLVAGQENAQVPAELLANALNFAVSSSGSALLDDSSTIVQRLQDGNVDALYSVANTMNAAGDRINSVLIWHALADGPLNHILSMVRLGFSYAEEDKAQAIKYFVQAGEDGPHQGALYNAGRLFLEANDLTRALTYIRAAATMVNDKHTAVYATPQVTQTAIEAYETLSDMLMTNVKLGLQDMVYIFEYASMDDFPKQGSKEHKLWDAAMIKLTDYTSGASKHQKTLEKASDDLSKLQNRKGLSKLQVVLLRNILVEVLKLVKEEEL